MTKAELIEKLRDARDEWAHWCDNYNALNTAVSMAEELDETSQPQDDHRLDAFRYVNLPMLQKGKGGLFYPCPMPVQQEPSPLELTARLWIGLHDSLRNLDEAAKEAFQLIDAVRAEEARRAGK